LLSEHEQSIGTLEIVPGKGGVFEVTVDGALVYSKKTSGRHAAPGEIEEAIRKMTGA
jgi:selenoprotein W-related protein